MRNGRIMLTPVSLITSVLLLFLTSCNALSTVRQVSISVEKNDDVTLSWLSPTSFTNMSITYQISCYQRLNPSTIRFFNTTQTTYKFEIIFNSSVDYVTQVRAIGSDGSKSKLTTPLIFRVFDSQVPPAPKKVTAEWQDQSIIKVTWSQPDFPIRGYRIYYINGGNDVTALEELMQNSSVSGYSKVEVDRPAGEYRLANLQAHRSYVIRLQAKNVANEYGPLSESVLAASDIMGSNESMIIQNVTYKATNSSITLYWDKPDLALQYYVVTYSGLKRFFDFNNRTSVDIDAERAVRIQAQDSTYTLVNLKPYMVYTISIQYLFKSSLGPTYRTQIRTNVGAPPIEGVPTVVAPIENNPKILKVTTPRISTENGPVIYSDLIVAESVFYDFVKSWEIIYDSSLEKDISIILPMEYFFIPKHPYITARFYKMPPTFQLGNWEFVNKFLNQGLEAGRHYKLTLRAFTAPNVYSTTEYSAPFEIHEDHQGSMDGGPNDQAGTKLILFVVADVMIFCMLSALGKLCHNHTNNLCDREKGAEKMRTSKRDILTEVLVGERNGRRKDGTMKTSASLEMT